MDLDELGLESFEDPFIDQRMMIAINKGPIRNVFLWKINSAFIFASYILKKSCHLEQFSQTFYTQRKAELLQLISNPSLESRVREVCFEEFIHTTFNIFRKSKDSIGIFLCPSIYLATSKIPINDEVRISFNNLFT